MCRNLGKVTFPKSLKRIEGGCFVETLWLGKQLKEDYIIVNDILLKYCNKDSRIIIPEDLPVTRIAGTAFTDTTLLEEITIPSGIRDMAEDTFYDCENLREVHLPDTWGEEDIRRCFYKTPWYYLRK